MKNKIIYVGESYSKQLEIAKSLTKNDLAIIMSNYGNYFSVRSFLYTFALEIKKA